MIPNPYPASPTQRSGQTFSKRGTVHPTTYTLHPTPPNPHPTHYTLHPAPYTLHPTPYNPHPSPHTLHPTTYTLHPTPQNPTPHTPHPTPYTLHPTPCTVHHTSHLSRILVRDSESTRIEVQCVRKPLTWTDFWSHRHLPGGDLPSDMTQLAGSYRKRVSI